MANLNPQAQRGQRMQDLLNYDYLPTNVRASNDLASFQREFSAETSPYKPIPQIQAAGARQGPNKFEKPISARVQPQPQFASAPQLAIPNYQRGTSAPQMLLKPQSQASTVAGDYETQYKIRQVELSILDFKGAMERKFNEIQAELPSRLQRDLNSLELREQTLAKDIAEKLAQFQDQHIRSRDSLREHQQALQDQSQRHEIQSQEMQYKVQALEKQLELQSVLLERATTMPPSQPRPDFNDVQILKDQLIQQQRRFELVSQESQRQYQHQQELIQKLEADMLQRLREQREANLQVIQMSDETKLKEYQIHTGQTDEANQMIRQVLSQIERKVEEDQLQRQQEQQEVKQQVESRLLTLVDKLKSDERLGLERERRLMEQVQEGLQTMNEIIKSTKEHGQVALSQQTQVIGEQLGSQFETIDEIRTYIFGRQDVIEHDLQETKQRVVDLEEATLKHVTNVNTVVETEMRRFDNVVGALEKHQSMVADELKQLTEQTQLETQKWRVDFEDITAKKITEIHQALKMINNQNKSNALDLKDLRDAFGVEMKMVDQNLTGKINELKAMESGANIDDKIQLAIHRNKSKIDSMVQDSLGQVNTQFGEAIETQQQKLKLFQDKVKAMIQESMQSVLNKMIEQNQKEDTILEGRCQQYTVNAETKLQHQVNQLMQKVDGVRDMIQKQGKAVVVKEEPKIDQFALVRDQGEREAALKDWTSSMLQQSFRDFEKLLAAKYNDLQIQIEASKADVIDSIQEQQFMQQRVVNNSQMTIETQEQRIHGSYAYSQENNDESPSRSLAKKVSQESFRAPSQKSATSFKAPAQAASIKPSSQAQIKSPEESDFYQDTLN